EQDLHRIVDTFTRCVEEVGYSRLVPMIEIERNGFNLNIARYIESSESKDTHSIEAHLRGGIPEADVAALGRYWDVFPSLRAELFEPDREGYARLTVASDRIDEVIFEHPEVAELVDDVRARLGNWRAAAAKALRSVDTNSHPKSIVADLSEELLDTFRGVRLIDPYDVYQQFMDYSSRTLLDDLYLVVDGGWSGAAKPRVIIDKKNQKAKDKEEPDFVVGKQKFKSDLLDAELMISRYFAGERAAIEQAGVAAAAAAQVVAGAAEEHGGEDGLLESVVSDSGNITKGAIAARLRELGDDEDTPRERDLLKVCLEALAEEANAKATGKRLTAELALKLQRGYAALTEDEARELTVGGKWLPSVEMRVLGEVERVTRSLSSRVAELAARYARSLPSIELEIDETRLAVTRHLASMGYEWS
ncbi:N-6 DNA methylase, partial [Microbacterium sp.]|uniref:N-6 DNA methylase n=1 Tax=Microbacterium sp. TaxID=51671 RepID=UPI0031FEE48C|nr:SAM-dependent methyltransferase [Microbacterium sp.]